MLVVQLITRRIDIVFKKLAYEKLAEVADFAKQVE